VTKTLFRFVKQVASFAQKHSAAGLLKISRPTGNGFAGWKHVVLHYLRIHKEESYAGVVDLALEMDRVRTLLNLPLFGFPKASTLYRSFNRASMNLWRTLLNRSTKLLDRSGHGGSMPRFSSGTRRRLITYEELIDRSKR
jgi:hypothetical protein